MIIVIMGCTYISITLVFVEASAEDTYLEENDDVIGPGIK